MQVAQHDAIVYAPAVPKPATNAANEFPRFLAVIACTGEDNVAGNTMSLRLDDKKEKGDTPTAKTVVMMLRVTI